MDRFSRNYAAKPPGAGDRAMDKAREDYREAIATDARAKLDAATGPQATYWRRAATQAGVCVRVLARR